MLLFFGIIGIIFAIVLIIISMMLFNDDDHLAGGIVMAIGVAIVILGANGVRESTKRERNENDSVLVLDIIQKNVCNSLS